MTSRSRKETSGRLSATEYAVLGLLREGPNHGFALSKELDAEGDLGRVLTVRRPLVYRALDRLVEANYVEPIGMEKGEGPERAVHKITPGGRRIMRRWLAEPVDHVRDLRIEFLLKLALLTRAGDSPLDLIQSQRETLDSTLNALDDPGVDPDHVELWRQHNAAAAGAYLEDLERIYSY